MRVLVYAAIRLFGESLGACLEQVEGIDGVQVSDKPADLFDAIERYHIDIVLFDVTPRAEYSTVRLLVETCPTVPILALAVPQLADDVIACADAGFVSYVPRDASLAELLGIMTMALRGEARCDPKITRSLFQEIHRRRTGVVSEPMDKPLTRREIEIFRLMSEGRSNKEIAADLSLSISTVKNHVHAVLSKLQLQRRAQAFEAFTVRPWTLGQARGPTEIDGNPVS